MGATYASGSRRNEPCHCGSGKKYKKCCLLKVQEDIRQNAHTHMLPGTVSLKLMYRRWPRFTWFIAKFLLAANPHPDDAQDMGHKTVWSMVERIFYDLRGMGSARETADAKEQCRRTLQIRHKILGMDLIAQPSGLRLDRTWFARRMSMGDRTSHTPSNSTMRKGGR